TSSPGLSTNRPPPSYPTRRMTTLHKAEIAQAKSRGPTTPEGKLASSQNAAKHGVFSRTMVLQCESQNRFEQVLAALKEQVEPRNSAESGYVESMAIARWRQMRVWPLQKVAIELDMAREESARVESDTDSQSETDAGLTPVIVATFACRNL